MATKPTGKPRGRPKGSTVAANEQRDLFYFRLVADLMHLGLPLSQSKPSGKAKLNEKNERTGAAKTAQMLLANDLQAFRKAHSRLTVLQWLPHHHVVFDAEGESVSLGLDVAISSRWQSLHHQREMAGIDFPHYVSEASIKAAYLRVARAHHVSTWRPGLQQPGAPEKWPPVLTQSAGIAYRCPHCGYENIRHEERGELFEWGDTCRNKACRQSTWTVAGDSAPYERLGHKDFRFRWRRT